MRRQLEREHPVRALKRFRSALALGKPVRRAMASMGWDVKRAR